MPILYVTKRMGSTNLNYVVISVIVHVNNNSSKMSAIFKPRCGAGKDLDRVWLPVVNVSEPLCCTRRVLMVRITMF